MPCGGANAKTYPCRMERPKVRSMTSQDRSLPFMQFCAAASVVKSTSCLQSGHRHNVCWLVRCLCTPYMCKQISCETGSPRNPVRRCFPGRCCTTSGRASLCSSSTWTPPILGLCLGNRTPAMLASSPLTRWATSSAQPLRREAVHVKGWLTKHTHDSGGWPRSSAYAYSIKALCSNIMRPVQLPESCWQLWQHSCTSVDRCHQDRVNCRTR